MKSFKDLFFFNILEEFSLLLTVGVTMKFARFRYPIANIFRFLFMKLLRELSKDCSRVSILLP